MSRILKASISELTSYWRVQESLLQGYRRLFLTLETILLSVAALSITKDISCLSQMIILYTLSTIGIVSAIFLIPIIVSRGKVVFYWQTQILKAERGIEIQQPLMVMKKFQKNKSHYLYQDEDFKRLSKGKNLTRDKLNFILPIIIAIAWVAIWIAYEVK